MPLFGKKQQPTAEDQAARAKFDWAVSAPPANLATELMLAAFRGRNDPDIGMGKLIDRLLFGERNLMLGERNAAVGSTKELEPAMLEAIQLLDHAELILCVQQRERDPTWRATRLGADVADNGKAAIRQRITDRTGL